MTLPHDLSPIDLLVLARLLVAPQAGVKPETLRKDLAPYLGHRMSSSEAAERIERSDRELRDRGLIVPNRNKKGGVTGLSLTVEGRARALASLGIAELPPKATWATIKKIHLPAIALGMSIPTGKSLQDFGKDGGFKAALLRSTCTLPIAEEVPTKLQAETALFWKLLGIETSQPFTVPNIKNALLGRALGRKVTKADAGMTSLLVAKVDGHPADAKKLRDALIRSWAVGESSPSGIAPPAGDRPATEDVPPPPRPILPIDEFARRVKRAAAACPTGKFGENKVFIEHVRRSMSGDPDIVPMDSDTFKRRLAEANNARLIDLSRADLVQAMDPQDVRDSEVEYHGATFHFIRI